MERRRDASDAHERYDFDSQQLLSELPGCCDNYRDMKANGLKACIVPRCSRRTVLPRDESVVPVPPS